MKPYKPLLWPRFWPFLRVVDEMPSHRINLHLYTSSFLICGGMIWGYSAWPAPSWVALIMVAAGFALLRFGPLRLIKAPPRQASNYLVTIVAKRGLPEHTLQQEIYESRYWLRHPWRLVDFFWVYVFSLAEYQWHLPAWAYFFVLRRYEKAAAHLSRVECASRAQEIRARVNPLRSLVTKDPKQQDTIEDMSRVSAASYARMYARSIHGAKNYPQFSAAGWTVDDVFNEIVRNL